MDTLILANAMLFLSTLSLRRATNTRTYRVYCPSFLSTLSLRRATGILGRRLWHREQFLSTLSLRRATGPAVKGYRGSSISIHALLAESDRFRASLSAVVTISIHALLAESDRSRPRRGPDLLGISIHALLAESDLTSVVSSAGTMDFYPRSPCGERPTNHDQATKARQISIHALLAESDNILCVVSVQVGGFLSTLSLRRATGGDHHYLIPSNDFYPRSPCGERLSTRIIGFSGMVFLSTLSLRRATWPPVRDIIQWEDFYPRSPCGERL